MSESEATEAETALNTPTTKIIYELGDVIFVLNNGMKLRISSVVMRTASSVFRAMFGPHFKEGQNLSEDNPKEVPLPDDDPAAVEVVCRLFHYQYNVQEPPELRVLDQISTFANKYDCATALLLASSHWMNHYISRLPAIDPGTIARGSGLVIFGEYLHGEGWSAQKKLTFNIDHVYVNLLGMAYRFDNASMFHAITKQLTKGKQRLIEIKDMDVVLWRTYYEVAHQRLCQNPYGNVSNGVCLDCMKVGGTEFSGCRISKDEHRSRS